MSRKQASDPHVYPDDDGYTLTRYLRAAPRMYGALRFTYRPVSSKRRAKFRDNARDGETEEQALDRVAAAVARQLVKWDAVDIKGKPLPTTAASVLLLHPTLQTELAAIVLWSFKGGDVDPSESDGSSDQSLSDPFGDNSDDDIVEAERKNS